MSIRSQQHFLRLAVACAAIGLAACDRGAPASSPASGGGTGAVVAKVNGDVLTGDQVEARVAPLPTSATAQQRADANAQAAFGLIDQQLLVQQAVAQGLDRDPKVQSQIEAARDHILAQTYLQRRVFAGIRPTDAAIREYYDANPALFGERRIYGLEKIEVQGLSADQGKQLQSFVGGAKKPGDVTQWLSDNHIAYAGSNGVASAEQLPLALLPRLAAMKDGQIGLLLNGDHATVILRARSQLQPVDLETARPAIERFLAKQQGDEQVRSELQRLRSAAKIDLEGTLAPYVDRLRNLTNAHPIESAPAPPEPVKP